MRSSAPTATGAVVHLVVCDRDVTGMGYDPGVGDVPGRVTIRAGGSSVVLEATTIARATQIILGEAIGRGSEG